MAACVALALCLEECASSAVLSFSLNSRSSSALRSDARVKSVTNGSSVRARRLFETLARSEALRQARAAPAETAAQSRRLSGVSLTTGVRSFPTDGWWAVEMLPGDCCAEKERPPVRGVTCEVDAGDNTAAAGGAGPRANGLAGAAVVADACSCGTMPLCPMPKGEGVAAMEKGLLVAGGATAPALVEEGLKDDAE